MIPATDAFPDTTPADQRHTQTVIGDHCFRRRAMPATFDRLGGCSGGVRSLSCSLLPAVVAKRQNWWAAFSTPVDRFLKESRTFRG